MKGQIVFKVGCDRKPSKKDLEMISQVLFCSLEYVEDDTAGEVRGVEPLVGASIKFVPAPKRRRKWHPNWLVVALPLFVLLSACGHYESDPAFVPYVDAFRAVMERERVAKYAQRWNVELKFGDPTVANLGECDRGDVQATVVVDKEYWGRLSDDERKLLIFHELGHCVLGRKHVPTFHSDENYVFTPDSIMYPDARSVTTAYRLDPLRYEAELVAGFAKEAL